MADQVAVEVLPETSQMASSKTAFGTDMKEGAKLVHQTPPESCSNQADSDMVHEKSLHPLLMPPPAPIHDRKRQREGKIVNEPRSKSQKIVRKKVTKVLKLKMIDINQKSQLNLIELNVDCLEQIFDYLEFIDLLNVANLDESLVEAARLSFSRRYSNTLFKFSGLESAHSIQVDDSVIVISSASDCLKMLRAFGGSIKKLQLQHFMYTLTADWIEVKDLFHKTCASSVIELKLINCSEEIFADAKKVFENVKELRISCSHLGKCSAFNEWFPQLEKLELLHNDGCVQILRHFPHLSYLAMDTDDACSTTDDLEAMIKSAPNLKTLSLCGGVDIQFFRFISENLKNLQRLYLWDFHLEFDDFEMVKFPSVESVYIATGLLGILPEVIPFEFVNLKDLHVISDNVDIEWIQFALAHTNLVKLQLDSFFDPEITDEHLTQIAKKLTKLERLDMTAEISPEGFGQFLTESKSLRKVRVKPFENVDFDGLITAAGMQWKATMDGALTLERKTTKAKLDG